MSEQVFPWHSASLLQTLAEGERLPHALLLHGGAGIGKSAYAQALAAALLCEARMPAAAACGRCAACGWIAAGNHPDLRVLARSADADGKVSREIRIDQFRALSDFLIVGGHRGGRRVVIVDPADAMNAVTANALLKTLEEPGDGIVFLLVTARPGDLPATIRSRCQARRLASPEPAAAVAWLRAQSGGTETDAAGWLAMAGGAPLHALRFAEPGQAAAHRAMLEAIAALPETSAETAADLLHRVDARLWLPVLQQWLTDVGRCRIGAMPRYFPAHRRRLGELAARSDPAAIAEAGRALAGQFRNVEHPLNPRLFCEASVACYLGAFAAARG